jgi:hypothetical protein
MSGFFVVLYALSTAILGTLLIVLVANKYVLGLSLILLPVGSFIFSILVEILVKYLEILKRKIK